MDSITGCPIPVLPVKTEQSTTFYSTYSSTIGSSHHTKTLFSFTQSFKCLYLSLPSSHRHTTYPRK